MRTLVMVGLIAGAVAVFAPDQGAGLMRSVVHGFGWGIGREVAHSLFGHHHGYRSSNERPVVDGERVWRPSRTMSALSLSLCSVYGVSQKLMRLSNSLLRLRQRYRRAPQLRDARVPGTKGCFKLALSQL